MTTPSTLDHSAPYLPLSKRVGTSMTNPWLWLFAGLIAFQARNTSELLILIPVLLVLYLLITVRTQRHHLEHLHIADGTVTLHYRIRGTLQEVSVPLKDFRTELMAKTKGPSGGPSLHVFAHGEPVLRQYTNASWSHKQLKALHEEVKNLHDALG